MLTEEKNQALVGAIPLCGEYPGHWFEDKFRSANQMDGISKAGGDETATSYFVSKRTCEIRLTYTGKSASSDGLYFCQILGNKRRHWYL